MNTRVALWRLQTPLSYLSAPHTEKACRSVSRTAMSACRILSTTASKASPSTLLLSQGPEVHMRRGSVGSGRWLRIKQLMLSPLEIRQAVRPLSLTPLLGGEDEGAPHFKKSSIRHPLTGELDSLPERKEGEESPYNLPHPIWSKREVEDVTITHTPPQTKVDKAAYYSVRALRMWFDIFSGYLWGKWAGTLDEKKWLTRIIFLETVAGVPGMIAAMTRHLKSLRYMRRDHGWIHTLLEEAENERMHLLTAMVLRNPGPIFKAAVIGSQGVFVTMFWVAYLISPRFCHRFVGYLEEEAVKTYTLCLESIDSGKLPMWAQMPAPPIAVKYWQLPDGAMMRDVILAIRADEAHHRLVNHTLSNMKPHDTNPYSPGK